MKVFYLFYFLLFSISLVAQNQSDLDNSVRAHVSIENNCLVLKWLPDTDVTAYQIQRKEPNTSNWGNTYMAELSSSDTFYIDCEIEKGIVYEYRIIKRHTDGVGYSYLYSGIEIPAVHDKGNVLVLIDKPSYQAIQGEIDQYINVIKSEGWFIEKMIVERDSSVQYIKEQIKTFHNDKPLKAILILGHVPVPQSGNIAPDGHNNHFGAWSADLYYGELNGNWTDVSINVTSSGNSNNHNIPGDGRLDQSYIPSDVDVAVGRVDFYDLPVFEEDEFELLRKYIRKSIAFRTKKFTPRRRATMRENFNRAEAFGQSAIRSFSSLVSPDSVTYKEFNKAFDESYLWLYGAGGGSYSSASGICNSAKFASDSLQAVFTMLFGSYFGDYNTKNNFMRSALASGTVLSCSWSGRPHWVFHPMALGFELGYATLLSQNNNGKYNQGFGARSVHVNLLGDPTLTSFAVGSPSNLIATEDDGHILVEWNQSTDDIMGYYLYRKSILDHNYTLVTDEIITDNFYRDSCLVALDTYEYRVRAVKLEVTASGSYYNLSGGPSYQITPITNHEVMADFDYSINEQVVSLENTSSNFSSFLWLLPDGSTSILPMLEFELLNNSDNEISLIAFNDCKADTITNSIFYSSTTDFYDEKKIVMYPNPTSGLINIKNANGPCSMTIYDNTGRIVYTNTFIQSNQSIDLGRLPVGIYTYKIASRQREDRGKVVFH